MDDRKIENITVGVRIRPFNSRELQSSCHSIWLTPTPSTIKEKSSPRTFTFDQVYQENTETFEIFNTQCNTVIENSISGYNGCIFCYGQTGSGKTFTMHGVLKQNPGIVPISISKIFTLIHQSLGKEFLIRCSYIELYNESINDLLNPASTNLQLAEDKSVLAKQRGIKIINVTEEVCTTFNQVHSLLVKGEKHKNIACTNFNQRSSRSHSIFRVIIESKNERSEISVAALNLIDLAGSESANVHGPASSVTRSRELKYINRSLLTLGTVIMRLSAKKNSAPIPYRDSKLTRILQPALEGESKVSIICNISISSDVYEDTLSTLKFAERAKKIKQTITKNEVPLSKALILRYQQEIQSLQEKLREMENRLVSEENVAKDLATNSQLAFLQEEKERADSRVEALLQEKLQLSNDLERLKSFIINSETAKPGKLVNNTESNVSSFIRNRTVSIADSPLFLEGCRNRADRRESLLIKGIENIELEIEEMESKLTVKDCLKLIKEQNKIIEDYEDVLKTQGGAIETIEYLRKELDQKDEEIEELKDELQLCRNNLSRLQMTNRLRRMESP